MNLKTASIVLVGVALAGAGAWQVVHGLHEAGIGRPKVAGLETASAAAHRAADKFLVMATGSRSSGQVPRLGDPAAGPLLDAVFDVRPVLGRPLPPFSQVDAVTDWLKSVAEVGQTYLLAGAGDATAESLSAEQAQKIDDNISAYAPEVGRFMDADLGLTRVVAAMTAAEVERPGSMNPTTNSGLEKVRSGITQTLSGAISTLTESSAADAWREARMPALVATAGPAHRLLAADQQAALKSEALQAARTTSDAKVKQSLAEFASAVAGG